MATTRPHLQVMLNELETAIPSLQQAYPEPDAFWPEFAAQAEAIEDAAEPADEEWVRERIGAMLRFHELTPPTDMA
jgi:hypothetical protein